MTDLVAVRRVLNERLTALKRPGAASTQEDLDHLFAARLASAALDHLDTLPRRLKEADGDAAYTAGLESAMNDLRNSLTNVPHLLLPEPLESV